MDRRKAIKTLTLGALASGTLLTKPAVGEEAGSFESSWQDWPDMLWTGPEYWGNRLQDWCVRAGGAECMVSDGDRTLHCLTHRLSDAPRAFTTGVTVELRNQTAPRSAHNYVGFRIGVKGPFPDHRSAAVYGQGIDAGLNTQGRLFVGEQTGASRIRSDIPLRLRLEGRPRDRGYRVTLTAFEAGANEELASVTAEDLTADDLAGNVSLVCHFASNGDRPEEPSARFVRWTIGGEKVLHDLRALFGPVCFAQYTLNRGILKLTAQLAPVERIRGHRVILEIRENGLWKEAGGSAVDPLARIARFRIEDWKARQAVPYRVRVTLPLRTGNRDFFYQGTVAAEPVEADRLKVALFSCNADFGFPDGEVVVHVNKHRPHLALFLGDQFYERNGGFGIQTAPLEKACLDVLRKWYMFGWSYRDIFRNIPAAFIPDDHDVYHGNIWGAGGKRAPIEKGWGYDSQDRGGYKMPPQWVNMVHRMQTSHLPDPHDPTPVKQGIDVYYTRWDYAGVSFALLADRKFKSTPKKILPEEAMVENGFITNAEFWSWLKRRDLPEADLLGARQKRFLEEWSADWSGGVQMKAVLSQTPFAGVHSLPEGATDDRMVPRLPIPEAGEYPSGDAPAGDMDTNGWPQNRRDDVVRILRKCFALHLAGDQHLATVVRYGIDDFEDAGFAFTGPALSSVWPRRWFPPIESKEYALPGKPPYTGAFFDAFGNRMTVYAAANPRKTGREPSILYDRTSGYGIVVFDKAERTVRMECWPRYADPVEKPDGQYPDWPLTVSQEDNYGRKARAWLPEIRVEGLENPVVEIVDEEVGERVYSLRIRGTVLKPKVFAEGFYTVRVGEPDRNLFDERTGVRASVENRRRLIFRFGN